MGFFCGKRMEKMLKAYEGGEIGGGGCSYVVNVTGLNKTDTHDADFTKLKDCVEKGIPVLMYYRTGGGIAVLYLVTVADIALEDGTVTIALFRGHVDGVEFRVSIDTTKNTVNAGSIS